MATIDPHQSIHFYDERKATPEILECHLAKWDRRIANWKPTNAWDAANQRPLKYYKKHRSKILKAIDRLTVKQRELERQAERNLKGVSNKTEDI
jgi:hypothetical protein